MAKIMLNNDEAYNLIIDRSRINQHVTDTSITGVAVLIDGKQVYHSDTDNILEFVVEYVEMTGSE